MKLSAPVYRLKRQARLMAREQGVPLHAALDRVAASEGFARWSLLVAKASGLSPSATLLARLRPGDLLLIGARPGHGKTLLGLDLARHTAASGRRSAFFSLEWTRTETQRRLDALSAGPKPSLGAVDIHDADAISADYITAALASAPHGSLAVIDYLQLLDQRRENPSLMAQMTGLRTLARERGVVMAFTAQIDRSYDAARKPCPDLCDVRLPNPLDLSLFDHACFLHDGRMQVGRVH